jgi:hypothetical protein
MGKLHLITFKKKNIPTIISFKFRIKEKRGNLVMGVFFFFKIVVPP